MGSANWRGLFELTYVVVTIISSLTVHHAVAELPSEDERSLCEARNGVMVQFSLSANVLPSGHSQRPIESDRKQSVVACVPITCVALETEGCDEVRSVVHRRLSEANAEEIFFVSKRSMQLQSSLSTTSSTTTDQKEIGNDFWFLHGVNDAWNTQLRETYSSIYYNSHDTTTQSINRDEWRAIVVGTHGPLSVLLAEHFEAAVQGSKSSLSFYGQCYLCEGLPSCRERFSRSLADHGCDWFLTGNRADVFELSHEVKYAAADIISRHVFLDIAICLGVLLCNALFEILDESVLRAQFLCMNPVQGTPEIYVTPFLRVLRNRVARGEVFTTNAITSALAAYHMDATIWNVKALSLFPQHLHEIGSRNIWSTSNRDLLYARSFILLHDPICAAFVAALQSSWPDSVREHNSHWDFSNEAEVEALLSYRAVVYMPEHPYKNVFNDFFAMGLPIFVPGIGFLAQLWPRVRHIERDAIYDGWFDRSISRVRLSVASSEVPEPFDLDVDGAEKVQFWLQLADYYNFPGVHTFTGLADLLQQLGEADLVNARREMQQHYELRRAAAVAAFRHLIAKVSKASLTSTSPQLEVMSESQHREPIGSALLAWKHGRGAGQPLGTCINRYPSVGLRKRQEISKWTIRISAGSQYPPVIRLQVWRPIRVGWMRGDETSTFQLVGENRAVLYPARDGVPLLRHVHVSRKSRIAMKLGDVIAWSSVCTLCKVFRGRGWWKSSRSNSNMRRHKKLSNRSEPQLCFDWYTNECRFWPSRKVCSFHRVASTPDIHLEVTLTDEDSDRSLGSTDVNPFRTLAYELTLESATFAMWLLEHWNQVLRGVPTSSLTFFVCPLTQYDKESSLGLYKKWRSVVTMFHISVGVSTRCSSGNHFAIMEVAEDFLRNVVPYTPWVVLSSEAPEDLQYARELAERSPSGSGWAFSTSIVTEDKRACAMTFKDHFAFDSHQACILSVTSAASCVSENIIAPELHIDNSWGMQVMSCLNCLDILAEEPLSALHVLLGCAQRAAMPGRYRSATDMALLAAVKPALDLGRRLDKSTTYEEFMTLRQNLSSPDLSIFEDKIRLRRELLQKIGVEHTPTYYMSNTDSNILPHIEGRASYVVKPTHMTESEHVFVVDHGRHLFDVRFDRTVLAVFGSAANATLIQERLSSSWSKTAYQWECNAVVSAKPGVIVEQLVFATMDPGAPDMRRVEEARFHVVWGLVMAVEWAVDKRGSIIFSLQTDRLGRFSLATEGMWTEGVWVQSFLRDPDGWSDNVASCLPKLEEVAQRVAVGAGADLLRVDFLIQGLCDRFYVSEVELFPAVPFPPSSMEVIERRWKYGYGIDMDE